MHYIMPMTNSVVRATIPREIQRAYRDNFARHLLGISLHLQAEIMNTLTVKHGHSDLRVNFEPYIAFAAMGGARLCDIAEKLGISRQAANQIANQIETAGYIQRNTDPMDARAKLIVTTERAKTLIKQGTQEALRMQVQFEEIVGGKTLSSITESLTELNRKLVALFPYKITDRNQQLPLAVLLPRLSDYTTQRLQKFTMAKGHPDLKKSFGQVLTAIGPNGGRIQQMAKTHHVSKQAISAVASELEELGYIKRDPDPDDARQVVLKFTQQGNGLLVDSVNSVDDLSTEFKEVLGTKKFTQMQESLAQIYRSLELEEDVFGAAGMSDTRVLARQLYRELGEEGAKALGQLLILGEPR
jgi:DNA-binding MarR family transcriptional regulator